MFRHITGVGNVVFTQGVAVCRILGGSAPERGFLRTDTENLALGRLSSTLRAICTSVNLGLSRLESGNLQHLPLSGGGKWNSPI